MNQRQRLMATLQGKPVDRPAVSFYEIGGFASDPNDPDKFNVYNSPSWRPLLQLAEEKTDIIRMKSAVRRHSHEAWDASQKNSSQLQKWMFLRWLSSYPYFCGKDARVGPNSHLPS